jgi:WD40 repeat protein
VITRDRGDGTYDVDYDDGEKETRVTEEMIRSRDEDGDRRRVIDSDEDLVRRSKMMPRLVVGSKVEARYRGKTKWYPGVITRDRGDGTYDVDYDDGEKETRVTEEMIRSRDEDGDRRRVIDSDEDLARRSKIFSIEESDDDDDGARPSDDPADSALDKRSLILTAPGFEVGTKVQVRFKGGHEYFPGVISGDHGDGTYDVDYDDGEKETRVNKDWIQSLEESKDGGRAVDSHDADSVGDQRSMIQRSSGFEVGTKVQVRFKGGHKFFPGVISGDHGDGTYDIEYDEGFKELRVKRKFIQTQAGKEGAQLSPNNQQLKSQAGFEVGSRVKAKFGGREAFVPGVISGDHGDGTYDIEYEDGVKETRVNFALIEVNDQQRDNRTPTLEGHRENVTSVVVTADGQWIVSGSSDETVKVWNMSTRECVATLEGHYGHVTSVALTADGQWIVSGSKDKTVKLWRMSTREYVATLQGHQGWVTSVCVTADGQWIVSGSYDETVRVWSLSTGECVTTLEGHEDCVKSVSATADGQWIVSGSYDNTVRIWSMSTRKCVACFVDAVSSVCVTPDGQWIVSGTYDKTVKVWRMSTRECVATLEGHQDFVNSVCVTADDQWIVSGSGDTTVKVWRMSTRECVATLEGHRDDVTSVCVTADGQWVASSSKDKSVRFWSLSPRECVVTLEGHRESVIGVTLTADAQYIVSGSHDKTVRLWRMSTRECVATLEGHQGSITSVCVTADGQWIVSGSHDATVKVWSMSTRECVATLKAQQYRVKSVCVTADGQWIVSGSEDKIVRLWRMSTRECVATLEGHQDVVTSVCVTADGQWIVSGSGDNTVKVWRMSTRECVATFEGHQDYVTSVCVTADGQWIVSGSADNTLRVWRMSTRECEAALEGHHRSVSSVFVTPDGQWIVSGSLDETVKVWRMSTRECVATLEGHQDFVNSVCVTADGQWIVSGSVDTTLRVFRFLAQSDDSVVFRSIDWLVKQFSAHEGSETVNQQLMHLSPKLFFNMFMSQDGERSTTYLSRAIELEAPDEMLEGLFKVKNPYPWQTLFHRSNYLDLFKPPRHILELLMDLKRERALGLVLDQILFGFDQHNQVRTGKLSVSQSSWRVTPDIASSPDFTSSVCRLINQYPQLAEDFLSKLGAVKTFAEVDAQSAEQRQGVRIETVITLNWKLPDLGFIVAGDDSIAPRDLWKGSLENERKVQCSGSEINSSYTHSP